MPVHAPGPRLFSTIPFHHLAQGHKKGKGGVNVSINVTPFVDMMTILVSFLLMSFSASGELIQAQKGLELPNATNKDQLRRAPVLIVSRDAVTFNGEQMADIASLQNDTSMEWKIIELYDRLRQEKTAFKMNFEQLPDDEKRRCREPNPAAKPEEMCLDGLIILQADKETNTKVLNRVIKTAYAAEYPNIMFAVNQTSRKQ
jgi:biopolymer transport protein ExbD